MTQQQTATTTPPPFQFHRSKSDLAGAIFTDPHGNKGLLKTLITNDPPKAFAVIERCFDKIIKKPHDGADAFLQVVQSLSNSFNGKYRAKIVSGVNQCAAVLKECPLLTAQRMVNSYNFDKKTGVSTFTVPAGVTDVEAMKVLNEYFRKNLPQFNRDAVYAGDLEWFENLPKEYPEFCKQRDYSQARQITIKGVVEGTKGGNRTTQGSVLRDNSLVFSDPRDQAIAAALHACKHDGEDLFKLLWVCGSVPGFALCTHSILGVYVCRSHDAYGDSYKAASGSPPRN